MTTSSKQQLNLNADFGTLVVASPNINVELTDDGRVVVHKGMVEQPNVSAKAEFVKALKTGDVITEGPNEGWIYCEGRGVAPFLVAPRDRGVMKWREAMDYAAATGAKLPCLDQLETMYKARNTGALKHSFNITGKDRTSWYWSAEHDDFGACSRRFSDGMEIYDRKNMPSSVRLVRPFAPA